MMKKQIKTMAQLRDSRLLFEKELPAFGYMIVSIVALIVVGLFVWGMYANKSYIIIAQGTITDRNSCYVMSTYSGEIDKCYLEEGKLVQEGDILFTIKSTDYNLQEEQLMASKVTYEERVEGLQLLVKSIKDNKNYFEQTTLEDELYYSTYEIYKAQIEQTVFDASTYQAYGYTDEQIEREFEKNQEKRVEIYYSAIQSAENSIMEAKLQLVTIEAQLAAIETGREEYSVKANNAGIIHLLADYKAGMVVQTGTMVAMITPENSEMVIEAYVSTADMARMEVGNQVQLAVDGLIQSVYGNITGTVAFIDSNMTSVGGENEQSKSVFKIEIRPDVDYLVSKSGKKVRLANGMTVEGRITYDEVTYFDYVLEKLGLLVR